MIACSNPLAQFQSHEDEIVEAIQRVLETGRYILGEEVARFERGFATYCDSQYGIGVNSGTDALILALRSLDVGAGDEVITVSHTALATVAAIVACGATPVLVDVDAQSFNIDPANIAPAITSRTRAIVPVHVYGQCADMDPILDIAGDRNLAVVEDCAQATGASYRGRPAGSMGDIGCFSFYPTKNLGGIGDGGMILTRNGELAQRLGSLRQYGWDANREAKEPGLNSRLDEIQAAILSVKLRYVDQDNRRRIQISRLYEELLADSEVDTPTATHDAVHVYHLYVVKIGARDAMVRRMEGNGILPGIHYRTPIHLQSGYGKHCRIPAGGLPVTERLSECIVSLPIHPDLTVAEVEHVAASLT